MNFDDMFGGNNYTILMPEFWIKNYYGKIKDRNQQLFFRCLSQGIIKRGYNNDDDDFWMRYKLEQDDYKNGVVYIDIGHTANLYCCEKSFVLKILNLLELEKEIEFDMLKFKLDNRMPEIDVAKIKFFRLEQEIKWIEFKRDEYKRMREANRYKHNHVGYELDLNKDIVICDLCGTKFNFYRSMGLCAVCTSKKIKKERRRLISNLNRTNQISDKSALTLAQWLYAIEYFEGKCAYCQSKKFEVMEHILPVSKGGLTCVDNCLPSCRSCNSEKYTNMSAPSANNSNAIKIDNYLRHVSRHENRYMSLSEIKEKIS